MIRRKGKKGSVLDVSIVMPIIIFLIAFMVYFGYSVLHEFNTQIVDDDMFTSDPDNYTLEFLMSAEEQLTVFDYGILFMMIALLVGAIAASYNVRTYPVFAIVFLIVIIISSIMIAYLANTFQEITSDSFFDSAIISFPTIYYVMRYFPWIIGLFSFITMAITFSKGE